MIHGCALIRLCIRDMQRIRLIESGLTSGRMRRLESGKLWDQRRKVGRVYYMQGWLLLCLLCVLFVYFSSLCVWLVCGCMFLYFSSVCVYMISLSV